MRQIVNLTSSVLFLASLSAVQSKVQEEDNYENALFGGGCFWCMQKPFDETEGVVRTTVGYSGGEQKEPTYEMVSSGKTGHLEVVSVVFDPVVVDYETLLKVFWKNVDPTDSGGQFCDRGQQYRSAIFFSNEKQEFLAKGSLSQVKEDKFPDIKIGTVVLPRLVFYPAEEYHQDYYKKNPYRYKYYKYHCGRDSRLDEVWISK